MKGRKDQYILDFMVVWSVFSFLCSLVYGLIEVLGCEPGKSSLKPPQDSAPCFLAGCGFQAGFDYHQGLLHGQVAELHIGVQPQSKYLQSYSAEEHHSQHLGIDSLWV